MEKEEVFKDADYGDSFITNSGKTVTLVKKRRCYNLFWEISCMLRVDDKYGFRFVEVPYDQYGHCTASLQGSTSMDISISRGENVTKELTAEDIYYFQNGATPDYDEWRAAGKQLFPDMPDWMLDHHEYSFMRGDLDYTR